MERFNERAESPLSPYLMMTLKDCEGVLALCEEKGRVAPEALNEIREMFGKVKELIEQVKNNELNEKQAGESILAELERVNQLVRDSKIDARSAVADRGLRMITRMKDFLDKPMWY